MQRSFSPSLLLVALVACRGQHSDAAKRAAEASGKGEGAPAPSTCANEVAALRAWMKLFARDYTPVEVPAITLLSAEGSPPRESGVVLALQPNRIWLDGTTLVAAEPIDSPDAIARLRTNARWSQTVKEGRPIYVAAEGDVNWNQLTEVLVAAGLRSGHLGFLFSRQRETPPPAPSSLTRELKGKKSLPEVGPAIARAFAPCAPLTDVLVKLGRASSDSLADILGEPIADAVAACDCSVPVDVVKTAYWWMLSGEQPTYAVATVTLMPPTPSRDPATTVLAFPDTALWKDVAPRLRKVAGSDSPQVTLARTRTPPAPPLPKRRRNE